MAAREIEQLAIERSAAADELREEQKAAIGHLEQEAKAARSEQVHDVAVVATHVFWRGEESEAPLRGPKGYFDII